MKKILFLWCLCLVQQGWAQVSESDRQRLNIKAKASIITEMRYRAFEKDGAVTKGSLKNKVMITFSPEGYVMDEKMFNDADKLRSRSYFKYDENKNLLEETVYKGDGNVVSYTNYKLDIPNKKRERKRTFADGTNIDNFTEVFDAKGKLIESISLNKSSDLKIAYKYDAKGNKIKEIRSDSKGVMSEIAYSYDDKGNATSEYSYSFKTGTTQVEFGEKNFYAYEYDAKGNWIKKTCYETEAKRLSAIIERVIEY